MWKCEYYIQRLGPDDPVEYQYGNGCLADQLVGQVVGIPTGAGSYSAAGDVVKENAGALPTHILAAGSYAVVADHGGLSYTRKFSIEQGEPKQIEVVVDDGPTTAEALQGAH